MILQINKEFKKKKKHIHISSRGKLSLDLDQRTLILSLHPLSVPSQLVPASAVTASLSSLSGIPLAFVFLVPGPRRCRRLALEAEA